MSNVPITFRTLDYLKFKRLVIDGDASLLYRSSKEVRSFHESIAIIKSRGPRFEPGDELALMKIYGWYKIVLDGKNISAMDMKLRSGWWGSTDKGVDAGKIKTKRFREVLLEKCRAWRQVGDHSRGQDIAGVFVFLHKTVPCFRYVGNSDYIFETVEYLVRSAFDGNGSESLTALLVTSLASSWHFYILPISGKNKETVRWLQNDVILQHDSIWPRGLNVTLNVSNNKDFSMLRRSCLQHQWPSDSKNLEDVKQAINLHDLLKDLQSQRFLFHFGEKSTGDAAHGLDSEDIKLSCDRLDSKRQESLNSSSSESSIISSITTTTIRTALELNELERNREDLRVKLNMERKRSSQRSSRICDPTSSQKKSLRTSQQNFNTST